MPPNAIDSPADAVTARFRGDRVATACVLGGDVQLACLAQAARSQGVACRLVWPLPRQSRLPRMYLRLDFPHGVAYCLQGRILVGPPATPFAQCRPVNGANRKLVADKNATNLVIATLGFPTPGGDRFARREIDAAHAYFQSLGGPACVKANTGSLGHQVFPGIASTADFLDAFRAVARRHRHILVERHIHFPDCAGPTPPEASFRFFFVKPSIVGVRMDLPAHVVGDGITPLRQLIEHKNLVKRTRTGQTEVKADPLVRENLRRRGYTLDDVPAKDVRLFLKRTTNSSQGGDSITLPAGLHPSYADKIATLCNAMPGLRVAAVDVMIGDHAMTAGTDKYANLYMNASQGMLHIECPG